MKKLRLELYVMGHSGKSQIALNNLRKICAAKLGGQVELDVIDVLERPDNAEEANIMVTPTLIKRDPPPIWRIIGDLSVTESVLRGLGLESLDDSDGDEQGEGDE